MNGYAVEPGELRTCDASLTAAAAHVRGALAQLQADADDVLGSWRGAAGTAFRIGWAQWLDGVDAMLAALEQLAIEVGASGAGYAAADEAVRTSVARVLR